MKKSPVLPTPQDARTHAGCQTKGDREGDDEAGEMMLGTAPRGSLQAFSDCLPGAWCAGVGGGGDGGGAGQV